MDRLSQLLAYSRHRDLTETERQELVVELRAASPQDAGKLLLSSMSALAFPEDMHSELAGAMLENILIEGRSKAMINSRPVHRVHLLKTAWVRYAAAIILITTGIAVYYNFSPTSKSGKEVVKATPPLNNIMPGTSRAVLTLSDGKKVELNNTTSEIINDGTLSINNNDGQLNYKKSDMVAMNTMTTPKGGQYQVTLADGTKVWLNAASSITYPTAFNGKTREVSITGEAYFEVAKNPSKQFQVTVNGMKVSVLGTHFNVSAYADEPFINTTLSEGSIKVSKAGADQFLKPGQQARLDKSGVFTMIANVDTSAAVAWKNGYFSFSHTDLQSILRQFSRWYNVTVKYNGDIPGKTFTGDIPRNANTEQILRIMEESNIHLRVEDNTFIVSP